MDNKYGLGAFLMFLDTTGYHCVETLFRQSEVITSQHLYTFIQ